MRAQELAARAAGSAGGSLEDRVSLDDVEAIACALLARGAGIVLVTLGPNGAYGATADEVLLREPAAA